MSPPMLSIVIPVYDDQENLDRICHELMTNGPSEKWELVVVDDGSPEPLHMDLSENWSLIRHEEQRGAAQARNTGAKATTGVYLGFLSVFLRFPETYVARILSLLEQPSFDIAQHLLVKPSDMEADHFQEYIVDQNRRVSKQTDSLPVKQTQFAATLLTRAAFMAAGGFDEHMNHYGGHELDLAYRLDQQGFSKRVIIPDLSLERVSLENHIRIETRLREYGQTGLPALLTKHPELKTTILVFPVWWVLLKNTGVFRLMERYLRHRIEKDVQLPAWQYRLYLHLIVRNAWDAR